MARMRPSSTSRSSRSRLSASAEAISILLICSSTVGLLFLDRFHHDFDRAEADLVPGAQFDRHTGLHTRVVDVGAVRRSHFLAHARAVALDQDLRVAAAEAAVLV